MSIELVYLVVNKIPYSLNLYAAIGYFGLNQEVIFRTRMVGEYPLQIVYKQRSLSWKIIYEEYRRVINNMSNVLVQRKYIDLRYVKYSHVIDILRGK